MQTNLQIQEKKSIWFKKLRVQTLYCSSGAFHWRRWSRQEAHLCQDGSPSWKLLDPWLSKVIHITRESWEDEVWRAPYDSLELEGQYDVWEGRDESQYELKDKEQMTEEVGTQAGVDEGVRHKS